MAEVALALSIVAVVLAAFACLLSLGTAARLERRSSADDGASAVPAHLSGGLPMGTHLSAELFRPLVGDAAGEWAAGPSLLVFGNSDCHACHTLLAELGDKRRAGLNGRVAVIDSAAQASSSSSLRPLTPPDATFVADDDGSVTHVFKVTSMPMTYLVESSTITGTHIGDGAARLLARVPATAPV